MEGTSSRLPSSRAKGPAILQAVPSARLASVIILVRLGAAMDSGGRRPTDIVLIYDIHSGWALSRGQFIWWIFWQLINAATASRLAAAGVYRVFPRVFDEHLYTERSQRVPSGPSTVQLQDHPNSGSASRLPACVMDFAWKLTRSSADAAQGKLNYEEHLEFSIKDAP